MNKLYKILAVSFLMVSHTSWGMLTLHKPGGSFVKKFPATCPVLNRSFREHQEMMKEFGPGELSVPRTNTAEEFLHVFGKQSLNNMPKKLCALGEKEGTRALCALSENQKFVLEISKNPDIKLLVMTRLLNGNKEMAQECCKLPIDQVMRCCADAQKMKINYPITIETKPCGEQHYMVLTKEQIYALSNVTKNGTIHNSEINEFMDGLGKLIKIDPNITCDQKGLTDSIRLYPSLHERAGIFWDAPGNEFCKFFIGWGMVLGGGSRGMIVILMDDREKFIGEKKEVWDRALNGWTKNQNYSLGLAGLLTAGQLAFKYYNYQNDLNNNFLPTQPTLTQMLENNNS